VLGAAVSALLSSSGGVSLEPARQLLALPCEIAQYAVRYAVRSAVQVRVGQYAALEDSADNDANLSSGIARSVREVSIVVTARAV